MTNRLEGHAKESKPILLGSKDKFPLKKEILADIQVHNTFAILSSTGNKDLAIGFVAQNEYGLYQIKTIASTPLKKGVDPKVAKIFYKEHLHPIIEMIKKDNIKTLILDYNLSFWAHVKNVNLSTYIIENSNVETVWTYAKTRIAEPENLIKNGEQLLTSSGTIALSFLKSYIPENLHKVEVFNQDLDKGIEIALEKKETVFTISPDEVFDREKDRANQQKIQALSWALTQSKKIRNPKYVEIFEELLDKTKEPVLKKKSKNFRKL